MATLTQLSTDTEPDLAHYRRESDAAIALLTATGKTVDLAEWLTIKRYAERYQLTTQVVTNWIARGIIPADCTQTLPELNDLRLVRNQAYK